MILRICPRWLYCKILGDTCFHMRKHETMPSCDKVELKGNFGRLGIEDKCCPELVECAFTQGDMMPRPWYTEG